MNLPKQEQLFLPFITKTFPFPFPCGNIYWIVLCLTMMNRRSGEKVMRKSKSGLSALVVLSILICCAASLAETIWKCPVCYTENSLNYCTQCGTHKPADIVCPDCGMSYAYDSDVKYCGQCGTNLSAKPSRDSAQAHSSLSYDMDISKCIFTKPEEISVSICITNKGTSETEGPVTLYYPNGKPVDRFIPPILNPGESRQWTGTWVLTEPQLKSGKIVFSLGYMKETSATDEEGNHKLINAISRLSKKIYYMAPEDEYDLVERFNAFFTFWGDNWLDGMLELCAPSWHEKIEKPKETLFSYLHNHIPLFISVESVSGAEEDSCRTVTLVSSTDRNNGKPPVDYRMRIRMLKENGKWFVDPESLLEYEMIEPEQTPTPSPTPAPTPIPTEGP